MREKRFTFWEMSVVLVVLAVHAALLAPTLSRAREEARRSLCAVNLGQTGDALARYEHDNAVFPASDTSSATFRLLLEGGFLPDKQILSCPSNVVEVDLGGSLAGTSHYIDPRAPNKRHIMRALAADRNLYGDWTDNHGQDGVNVLFSGGAVRFVRDAEVGRAGYIANPFLDEDQDIYEASARGDERDAWITGHTSEFDDFRDEENNLWVFTANFYGRVPAHLEGDATVVIVGGGGGGGANAGGGGGGGQVVVLQDITLLEGALMVVEVGRGGRGGFGGVDVRGEHGGDSSFNGVVAMGGGGANRDDVRYTGGGGNVWYPRGVGAPGGDGGKTGHDRGSGGGGASGEDGHSSKYDAAGDGGTGIDVAADYGFSVLVTAKLGSNPYGAFGGGGGGGRVEAGAGGMGGGGNGSDNMFGGDGYPGTVNTGGGGGGSGGYVSPNYCNGGNGGSGIVIIIPGLKAGPDPG